MANDSHRSLALHGAIGRVHEPEPTETKPSWMLAYEAGYAVGYEHGQRDAQRGVTSLAMAAASRSARPTKKATHVGDVSRVPAEPSGAQSETPE